MMMTDGELIKAMYRLARLCNQMHDLMYVVSVEHPNGKALVEDLHEEGLGCLWDCVSIAYPHLIHPERWEQVGRGLERHLRRKAAETGVDDA